MTTLRKISFALALALAAAGFAAAFAGVAMAGPSSAMVPPDPY